MYDLTDFLYYAIQGMNVEMGDVRKRIEHLETLKPTTEVIEKIKYYNELLDEMYEKYQAWMHLDNIITPWEEVDIDDNEEEEEL